MIRLSRLADYGVVLMGYMATHEDGLHTTPEISAATGVPIPTVSKIVQTLAHNGLLRSHRGMKGGYTLARSPQDVSVAAIISALDGPIALTQCIEQGPGACGIESSCPSRYSWHRINEIVTRALDGVSLAEIAMPSPSFPPPSGDRSGTLAGTV